jgi:hypothetical protein
MASVCAFKLPILKKAITKFRKSERIVGPKGTVAIQELLLKQVPVPYSGRSSIYTVLVCIYTVPVATTTATTATRV